MEAARRVALITGATRGIGLAFAREYAQAHHRQDLILVGRSEAALRDLVKQLRKNQGGRIEIIVADLSAPDSGEGVAEQVMALGMKVDVLVNAASADHVGDFIEQAPQTAQAQITLQCAAMVDLCQVLAPAMVAQRSGTIINVAAAGGSQPRPYASVAGGVAAFVLSFTQALRAELRPQGLRVVAICPAPARWLGLSASTSPETLVKRSLRAVRLNRATVTPGWRDALAGLVIRVLPTRVIAARLRRRR
ncbi:SDR family NAD(P)-dependent oxidoreductase [Hydrocarboniphaga sp.]|uniref:SDR family NAD(P)-dependent oxidoreductase n=1 Tax=Hydrocarboniphaga sp. TaxID=2033016 RepID=UPI003D118476